MCYLSFCFNDSHFVECTGLAQSSEKLVEDGDHFTYASGKESSQRGGSWSPWLALGAAIVVIGVFIYFSDSYFPCSPNEFSQHGQNSEGGLDNARDPVSDFNQEVGVCVGALDNSVDSPICEA